MSETDPGHSDQHAGYVGARRATVGTPTERDSINSINVPQTRPGAVENARRAEAARQEHETFLPENPIPDERAEAAESSRTEEETVAGARGRREEDDEEEEEGDVRKDIKEARRELGDTISALAAKTDVKARASHAAEAARDRASHAAEAARGKASHAAEAARDRAGHAADTVKHKASELGGKVREGTSHQVKDASRRKKLTMLLVAIAGAVTAFVTRRLMRRSRSRTR
ncbi:DUF3618 domain-containing protein [Nonomuraea jiangxiensis]|uniref:DUF3618 domain-containing protein n=1 Tax=Nonomuraea jiangxiensis TaxID=633440 RepID=A0A1G8D1M1_9ACTN|nr:DUF3618 domain-containing protein [Nonomuraea jiangxiensis]SDH51424.1 Protein of unknown function [Nonomuraea jiangxiensis]